MDISLNFIILAVLALIALIIVALFFTGGLTNLFEETEEVGDVTGEQIALAEAECVAYCYTGSENSWNNPGFTSAVEEAFGTTCEDLTGSSWSEVEEDCDVI